MSVRWLPNPNGAHSQFPRDFRCSYEDLVHYSSKDSRALSRLSRETTLPLECLSRLTHQTPPSENEEWLEGWVVIVKVSKRLAHLKDGTGLAAVKGDANLVGVVIAIATAIGIAMMAELGKTGWALRTSLLADLSSRVSKEDRRLPPQNFSSPSFLHILKLQGQTDRHPRCPMDTASLTPWIEFAQSWANPTFFSVSSKQQQCSNDPYTCIQTSKHFQFDLNPYPVPIPQLHTYLPVSTTHRRRSVTLVWKFQWRFGTEKQASL